MDNCKTTKTDILENQHKQLLEQIPTGRTKAIPLNELAEKMDVDSTRLLMMIEHAQIDGNIIAVEPVGVFIPETEFELRSYAAYEKARINFEIEALNTAYKKACGESLILVYKGEDYEE